MFTLKVKDQKNILLQCKNLSSNIRIQNYTEDYIVKILYVCTYTYGCLAAACNKKNLALLILLSLNSDIK